MTLAKLTLICEASHCELAAHRETPQELV